MERLDRLMILTAHQPVWIPWLGLFHKIALADKFVFFDDVQYQPKDYNNRNKIKFPDGEARWLSVPVSRKGYLNRKHPTIEIANQRWQRKHWGSIVQCYNNAPYWNYYSGSLKEIYDCEWKYLWVLNWTVMDFLAQCLGIDTSGWVKLSDLQASGAKSELVLNMCKELGAKKFIFGIQGKDYADVEAFEKAGVEVIFQQYNHPIYQQIHGAFISHLSVIDLLFNHGPESMEIIMSGNVSKEFLEK